MSTADNNNNIMTVVTEFIDAWSRLDPDEVAS
jgi:hypothetical protein